MRIAQRLLDEIVAHARDEAPNECCGLVGGKGDLALSVLRARNLHESPLRFEVADMPKLLGQIEDEGHDHVATYHSHTRSEAYPSQTDVNLAEWWPELIWLICSLLDSDAPVVRAFLIEAGQVRELELVTD